ncbi:acyltransferase family protein [Mycolicibacterium neoaurum]|uniref:acyltransferase family protein n=1 Tax=Mycolicibacterium neoaurum TaxID=1795 RepID=UPI0027DF1A74|nr:acyltransferase family protein [Mycolicibacterium neoaurum]
MYETSTAATWAYFDTFARAWELGVGALLATANTLLARIPDGLKPFLSWTGLFLIAGSLFVISEDSIGFPAPWALMPVVGASLVIMAGVQGEPRYQGFLRNRVSVYIGNISYSLYLVHWPVIVFLTVLMPAGGYYYYAIAVTLTFGLSIASYHFVEAPFRHRGSPGIIRRLRAGRDRDVEMEGSAQYAALAALALVTVSVLAFSVQPPVAPSVPPVMTSPVVNRADAVAPVWGPLTAGLQEEIEQALQASEWPPLEPSVESVVTSKYFPDLESCNGNEDPQRCTWGEPTAATRVLLAGDSIAMTYAEPLRRLALNSSGRIQVTLQTLAACRLVNFYPLGDGPQADQQSMDACEIRKQQTVDLINTTKPSIVIISNAYNDRTHDRGGSSGWYDYRREMIDRFKESTGKIVLLSAPPEDKSISECFSTARSVPADCISRVTPRWHAIADVERRVAASVGGVWVDSRPWFCSTSELCPAFVGSLLTKRDRPHMSMAYAQRITPVIEESLRQAGVL